VLGRIRISRNSSRRDDSQDLYYTLGQVLVSRVTGKVPLADSTSPISAFTSH
jgi:hypothetical protein